MDQSLVLEINEPMLTYLIEQDYLPLQVSFDCTNNIMH